MTAEGRKSQPLYKRSPISSAFIAGVCKHAIRCEDAPLCFHWGCDLDETGDQLIW